MVNIKKLNRIAVFCGSRVGDRPEFKLAAEELGRRLAELGIGLIYGGASIGLMGAVADAALGAGGRVQGTITESLAKIEIAHDRLTDLFVVSTMHERKRQMCDAADGFIALPGGLGTLDELCEISTWSQLGIHEKPIGMLNVAGYFDAFLDFLDRCVAEGFVTPAHRDILLVEANVDDLISRMANWTPSLVPKLDSTISP